ncbi:iodotyrosine deiodinase isoform X2 [Octopus bimaculoides]|uniref:iodotyrosine deiodinase isoform X2 n=1 Tax=Octopus bimaculoides TaxID=37653 RepID=UPI00071CEE36|nr:iodotyrosine deiodinase isoform X2 [Octopus bimaculoides]|eukprot:XP_014783468.1 PREDICTED: iodotyrosine deiodinase 1-like isoform X2 [Octopus bimaculoides]
MASLLAENSEDMYDETITNENDARILVPVEDLVPQTPFNPEIYSEEEMLKKSKDFYQTMNARRSCRFISSKPVPIEIINNLILTAGTSPSGAHTQPWTYAVISNQQLKAEIRKVIETEEEMNYRRRMGKTWVYDVQTRTQTTWVKPYLEEAPYIIVILKKVYGIGENNKKINYYYNEISASISVGIMLAAIQNAGLVTVTTTPLNAGPTLRQMLQRPINEKVLILLPIGYAAKDATVPDLERYPIESIMKLYD